MEKTILQWLNEIEEPEIREAAIRNYNYDLDFGSNYGKLSHLSLGIAFGFDWSKSEEGYEFWEIYHEKIRNKEI